MMSARSVLDASLTRKAGAGLSEHGRAEAEARGDVPDVAPPPQGDQCAIPRKANKSSHSRAKPGSPCIELPVKGSALLAFHTRTEVPPPAELNQVALTTHGKRAPALTQAPRRTIFAPE